MTVPPEWSTTGDGATGDTVQHQIVGDSDTRDRPMFDTHGWHKIACGDRDTIVHGYDQLVVFSSLTDPHGEFGSPLVYTEWGLHEPDRAILRDYRWPDDDERACEHWVPDSREELR